MVTSFFRSGRGGRTATTTAPKELFYNMLHVYNKMSIIAWNI